MAVITEHLLNLAGQRSGDGPATWGQQAIWQRIRATGPVSHIFNFGRRVPVPAGLPMAAVLDALGQIVGRHDSLRTRYAGDEPADLRQHLPGSDALVVGVCEAGGQDLTVVPPELAERLIGPPFDPAADIGIRALIVTEHGAPHTVLLGLSHLAVDRASARIVGKDLAALLKACVQGRAAPEPAPARQPLEQARYESSADGARVAAKALQHWRSQLETVPATAFPATYPPHKVRFCAGELRSTAVAVAADMLAVRYRSSTSTILLAANAVAVGRVSGVSTYPVRLLAGNRWVAGLRHAVGSLAQYALTAIDLSSPSFAEVVRRAWSSAIVAYANGQYDPTRLGELERVMGLRRSAELNVGCYFNDLRADTQADWGRAAATTPDAVRAARADTTFRWLPALPSEGVQCFLFVNRRNDAMVLSMLADTTLLAPERIRAVLYDIERMLVAEAAGP